MDFESDILGEFSESFSFVLRGNEEPIPCQFKGHVVSIFRRFRCPILYGIILCSSYQNIVGASCVWIRPIVLHPGSKHEISTWG